jgi:hypothetical protein
MTRILVLPALVLGLVACGDSDYLTVRGEAAVDLGSDRVERYPFPQDVRLEPDWAVAQSAGVFAGRCVLTPGAATEVDVEVARPGAESGMTSFAVRIDPLGGGDVTATIDGTEWSGASAGGACLAQTTYLEPDDELVGIEVDCMLGDGAGGVAVATAELFFEECADLEE